MTSEITLRIIFMLLNLKKFLNPKYRPRLWGKMKETKKLKKSRFINI